MIAKGQQEDARFAVWLFTHDCPYGAAAMAAGATGVVIDWEHIGKELRQNGRDTQINQGTAEHLQTMRRAVQGMVACRINNLPLLRTREARLAADLGADEVWLPMVRSMAEVEECLAVLPTRCRLGILAETPEGMALAGEFDQLPLARVYVGLNDLWIASGRPHLFSAMLDGAVQEFRERYTGSFGVAGITRPTCGSPVPCRLLLAEMARLQCDFGVARRAFRHDTSADELPQAIGEIRAAMRRLSERTLGQVAEDERQLRACLQHLGAGFASK